jgi:hypothetical protein
VGLINGFPVESTQTPEPTPVTGDYVVSGIPNDLNVDRNFYKKYCRSQAGVHITSSDKVADSSLVYAAKICDVMCAKREDVARVFRKNNGRVVVMAWEEKTSDIPEWSHITDTDWARGLGGGIGNPFSGCGEENLNRESYDPYRSEFIHCHEFGHSFHGAVYEADRNLYTEIQNAYNAARSAGLWDNTYAGSNMYEYFAEGVQDWYGLNAQSSSGNPDGVHNHVDTREELFSYDRRLYDILESLFDTDYFPPPCDKK